MFFLFFLYNNFTQVWPPRWSSAAIGPRMTKERGRCSARCIALASWWHCDVDGSDQSTRNDLNNKRQHPFCHARWHLSCRCLKGLACLLHVWRAHHHLPTCQANLLGSHHFASQSKFEQKDEPESGAHSGLNMSMDCRNLGASNVNLSLFARFRVFPSIIRVHGCSAQDIPVPKESVSSQQSYILIIQRASSKDIGWTPICHAIHKLVRTLGET